MGEGQKYGKVSRCLRCLCYLHLSDPVEEGHDLAAGAVVIDAELALVRSGRVALCYSLLRTPEDSLIERMVHRNVAERRLRYGFRLRLALVSPDEHHDLAARAGIVYAELALVRSTRVALRDSFLLSPENCLVEGVSRRNI